MVKWLEEKEFLLFGLEESRGKIAMKIRSFRMLFIFGKGGEFLGRKQGNTSLRLRGRGGRNGFAELSPAGEVPKVWESFTLFRLDFLDCAVFARKEGAFAVGFFEQC